LLTARTPPKSTVRFLIFRISSLMMTYPSYVPL
jgi:hypothetical protein